MDTLAIALKEWDLLISALLAGEQAILLRKGGILESDNQFELEHNRFLFYPTFIHQNPRMVKAPHRAAIRAMAAEPGMIDIRGYGEAAAIFEVPDRSRMDALNDLHLWDTPLIDMRFAYRPEKPLYLVVIRAFALAHPVTIENTLEYAGCKSWVPLLAPLDVTNARPAIAPEKIAALIDRIQTTFKSR